MEQQALLAQIWYANSHKIQGKSTRSAFSDGTKSLERILKEGILFGLTHS